jgi:hypothetical protein
VDLGRSVDADPDEKPVRRKNSHHSSVRRTPFVWRTFKMFVLGVRYRCWAATARPKKSSPMSVGSPPCRANTISGDSWLVMY